MDNLEGPTEPKSEQTREIEAALSLGDLGKQQPVDQGSEEWERWAQLMTDQVDKLMSDSRTLKIGLAAVGFGAAVAIGIGAMTSKALSGVMQAVSTLGQNQVELANYIGNQQPPDVTMTPYGTAPGEGGTEPTIVRTPDPTVNLNGEVAPPFEGPASEASADAKAQMQVDKAAGIIDASKGEGEPS